MFECDNIYLEFNLESTNALLKNIKIYYDTWKTFTIIEII